MKQYGRPELVWCLAAFEPLVILADWSPAWDGQPWLRLWWSYAVLPQEDEEWPD